MNFPVEDFGREDGPLCIAWPFVLALAASLALVG